MSGLSKVIVVYPDDPDTGSDGFDARAGRQVQLGFEREGVPTVLATTAETLPLDGAGLVVVGGTDGKALELVRAARTQLTASSLDIPIVFAGKGVRRTDAEAAGADEVVLYPAYLRDVVTVGRLLRGLPTSRREHLIGSLAETTGVFTLVRALSALGRSAVLTLVRGLRRGEIRFFHGEVTSAELALIHGQAALHQLLLWTEARFEFLHEDVVRRQQIPMSHEELFADAERFLEGVRDSSGTLSPSMVLEQDVARIQSLGMQVPTEVHGVLRLFDGHRVLADILEDSPYRVFETLRVAQRAVESGLLRVVETQRPKAKWRAVLSIEEWLTGQDRDAVVERAQALIDSQPVVATADTAPTPRESKPKLKRGKRKSKPSKPPEPAPVEAPVVARTTSRPSIDWGALVPRVIGSEVGSLSQVVPAAQRSGEISLPTRDEPREKLEALMDTGAREKMFAREVEPSVVIAPPPSDEDTEEEVATTSPTGLVTPDPDDDASATAAAADKAAADKAAADKAAADKAAADKAAADKAAADKLLAEKAAAEKAAAEKAAADKAAADKAAAEKAAADKAAAEKAVADKLLAEKKAAAEKAAAEKSLAEKAEAEKRAAELKAKREAAEEAEDARLRAEAVERAKKQAAARAEAADQQAREAADLATRLAEAKAKAEAERLAANPLTPDPDAGSDEEILWRQAEARARAAAAGEETRPVPRFEADELIKEIVGPKITVVESPTATVVVQDTLAIGGSAGTAVVTSTPTATVSEAPEPIDDEPSDGVVRHIPSAETKPAKRPPPPGQLPPDDRPGDRTGEITSARKKQASKPPKNVEPSILIEDLAAAHDAIAAVAAAQADAPASPDLAAAPAVQTVAQVRKDAAIAFSDAEEAFFRAGSEKEKSTTFQVTGPVETFDDLDEDYAPLGFWDRLRGKPPPKK